MRYESTQAHVAAPINLMKDVSMADDSAVSLLSSFFFSFTFDVFVFLLDGEIPLYKYSQR